MIKFLRYWLWEAWQPITAAEIATRLDEARNSMEWAKLVEQRDAYQAELVWQANNVCAPGSTRWTRLDLLLNKYGVK